jgi:flavin-dependent dehydrogenase
MTTRIKSVENGWWYSSKLPDGNRVISFHGITDDIAKLTKSIPLFIDEANKSQVVPFTISATQILEGVVARNASSSKSSEVIGDNWLAVGDAALSFDPLSSQGIFFALYSGVRAAETIASILNSPEHTSNFTSDYRLKVQNVFEANQNARKYHYTSERRFMHHPYWKQYLK